MRQLGGRIGSTALVIGGQAEYAVGEEVIAFLEERPRDRSYATTGLWQGKFTIAPGTGGEVAIRRDSGAAARGVLGDNSRTVASWLPTLADAAGAVVASIQDRSAASMPRSAIAPSSTQSAVSWVDPAAVHGSIRVDVVASEPQRSVDRSEQAVRAAADFWSATGGVALATGGLEPSGCFISHAPDGRIAIGLDGCGELSPRGGTVAASGSWIRYDVDASGSETPRFLGGGVIVNRGDATARLLSDAACFDRLATHELGHALGFADGADGAGAMSPLLRCRASEALTPAAETADQRQRPVFAPLGSATRSDATARENKKVAERCLVGCEVAEAAATWSTPLPAPVLTYALTGPLLTLGWTSSIGGIVQQYRIDAGSRPGAADVASIRVDPSVTSFSAIIGGNALFYIRVYATNFQTSSPPSNEIVVVVGTPTAPPDPPAGLAASASGSTVTLTWNAPATGGPPSSYIIEAGSSPGLSNLADFSTGTAATTYVAGGVGAGAYSIRVRSSNAGGVSGPSNEVLLLVGTCAPPSPPASLGAFVNAPNVTLGWVASIGATSYQLQVGSRAGVSDLLDTDLQSAATSLRAFNVAPGTYFVRVRGNNGCGQSAASNEVVVVIQ